jgi:hypothetical protein
MCLLPTVARMLPPPTSADQTLGRSEYAEQWMNTLKDDFIGNIGALRQNAAPIGLAERLNGKQTPQHIRIAVLDTGVDPMDVMIKAAKSRIIDKRSWVGSPDSCDDTYGHGTHVARLLLSMAPAAQIFVAKITDNKHVHPSEMSNIGEVSFPYRQGSLASSSR